MTQNYKKMCRLYRLFAENWDCDFSDQAMQEMFEFETYGRGNIDISVFNTTGKKPNGYAVGKKWLNVTVSGWREDLEKWKTSPVKYDVKNIYQMLEEDPTFDDYRDWVDKVLGMDKVKREFKECAEQLALRYGLKGPIKP